MDLERFLNLLAAVLGAMGSFYTLRGVAALSPDLAARLSRTYFGFNTQQIDALASQKADAIVGIALVAVALLIAIVGMAALPSAPVRVIERRDVGVAIVGILAGVTYILLVYVGGTVHKREKLAVGRILAREEIALTIGSGKLTEGDAGSLKTYGALIGLVIDDSETRPAAFRRLAVALGLEIPAGFDYSAAETHTRGK